MSTAFITQDIWPQLTKEIRACRQPCAVAVAYFGKGAGRLLPLRKGSQLAVDASEGAVASGQTCPADLIALVKRGVKVFSMPFLHAKVFVVGSAAYVGSANVSSRSESQLVEAVIRTTEARTVKAARQFVEQCQYRLTPSLLERLAKLYRPPRIPGGKRGKKDAKAPRLPLAQLKLEDWPEQDQTLHDRALPVAEKRREFTRGFELESFRLTGKCDYERGDEVIQVTDQGDGRVLIAPPGNVLHVRTRRDGKRTVSFVYLERPTGRRKQLKAMASALGHGASQRLRRDGVVRNQAFAKALLQAWAD